jgi:hypothetical protein
MSEAGSPVPATSSHTTHVAHTNHTPHTAPGRSTTSTGADELEAVPEIQPGAGVPHHFDGHLYRARLQPEGIPEIHRIVLGEDVGVDPALEANGVFADEPG